ncbi:MAG: hypothetical protein GY866_41100, partial [Proteobacteria bacterium]|nr:hypothetical protein [Pseudomonadota bacterium]
RILVGDNGRIYGVFQSWVMQNQGTRPQNPMDDPVDGGTTDSNLSVSFLPKLTVYQILPFDGTPKLELTMPEDGDWWTWMGNTPFQVANGYLFYKELYDSADYYGTKDVIRLIELEDRTETVLLDEVDQRYEIYNWRLTGNTLYFSALDKVDTKVVVGAVDTGKITADASSDDYLTITQTDSASGTISAVQDMELLVPEAVEEDTGVAPSVLKIHAKSENLYSLSVDFNKNMDRESVEEAVSLIDTSNETTLLDTLKIWVKHTLHLIPDLDETGTADSTSTTPLLVNSEYKLELGDGVLDHWGTSLEADTQKTRIFKTRPASGWYMTDTDAGEPTISDGNVAKYAMEDTDTASDPYQTDSKVYAVATGIPADFRLEFSAINYGTGGINLFLIDTTPVDLWGELTPKTFYEWPWSVEEEHHIQLRLGKWSELLYCTNYEDFWWDSSWGCWSDWTLQETPALFNGNWQRYQVDVYGSTVDVFYKNTEGNPVKIHGLSREDLMSRVAGHNFNLYIGVIQPVGIDNLRIYPLSEAGVEETVYKLTDKSLETLEKTIPAADWAAITASGNDIRDLKNKSYSTEAAFKNALSGKITGGMYTAHENEIMEALENHDYVLNLDFDGNGGKELFQALFDPLLEVDDGSVLQDVIGGSSLSGNEGTKFSGIMLTTETESFQRGVGSQGTSYYTFELDWADTGEYQITLVSAEDLSNITISHYEGEAVRDNLQSSCSLGENPCTIEVYWSWPAPMIAVRNDGAAITDFSILVAKVGGAHLSEGT